MPNPDINRRERLGRTAGRALFDPVEPFQVPAWIFGFNVDDQGPLDRVDCSGEAALGCQTHGFSGDGIRSLPVSGDPVYHR